MYEIFNRKVVRTGTPAISINTTARIGVNRSATEILQKNGVEYALLLWDKEESKIGIQAALKTDTRAYRIAFNKKGTGAFFSAKTFFHYILYDYSQTRSYIAEWNSVEKMLEVRLGNQAPQMTQQVPQPRGRPRKRLEA